ncbi:MAG: T9SS type A sorting domain-containing protein [Bacteroidetes bacterium]|nr:T9SS type A sorting domain-containing protein [Bacteroidota bacterium]
MIKQAILGVLLLTQLVINAQVTRPVGVNLSYINDYSTELVFTNAFRQCRPWISANADDSGPWDTQINIPLRPDGYPVAIPYNDGTNPPQRVKTLLVWDLFDATPVGLYRLKTEGQGRIRLSNGTFGEFNSPIDTLVEVNAGVILEILESNVNNPVRNIEFVLPKYVNTYKNKIFTDELVKLVNDFQVIRFMDFTYTNNSPVVSWNDRTQGNYYSQGLNTGASWEVVTQLANLTRKDVWINIPHQADNNYIDSLATFLQRNLHAQAKIYLEYSNETWNGIFDQNYYCADMGEALGYTGEPWERTLKFTAKRSADIFTRFEAIFTNDARLIKLLPSQAANSGLADQLVTFFNDVQYNPTQVKASAIAIAPYFGTSVADDIVANNQVNSITVPGIMNLLRTSITETEQWMIANKEVADFYGLDLVCYEGGQHLAGTGNNANNDVLTEKLINANRNAEMGTLYCDYLNRWYERAGGLFCHFNSVQPFTQFGSWGLMESQQDTLNPKYQAVKQCVFALNTTTTRIKETIRNSGLKIYPNPVRYKLYLNTTGNSRLPYQVFNTTGQMIKSGIGQEVDMSNLKSGMYFIRIENKSYKVVKE